MVVIQGWKIVKAENTRNVMDEEKKVVERVRRAGGDHGVMAAAWLLTDRPIFRLDRLKRDVSVSAGTPGQLHHHVAKCVLAKCLCQCH